MKIRPLGNRIIVKKLRIGATASGLALPEGRQQVANFGTVIAAGPGYLERIDDKDVWTACEVKVGDTIVYFDQSGLNLGGTDEIKIFAETGVLAIVSEEGGEIGDLAAL